MDNEQYSQHFVAFLDILGFKNLVNNPKVSCADILKIYKYFINIVICFLEKTSKI